jgi:hypothetical protein
MPRAASGKLVKPRERRSPCGPSRVRVPDAERLQALRARLASTEVISTIRAISADASELAATAAANLLHDIGDVVDRAAEKIERLSPPKAPRTKPRKPRPPTAAAADMEEPAAFSVKGDDQLLRRLIEVHGEARADIPIALASP